MLLVKTRECLNKRIVIVFERCTFYLWKGILYLVILLRCDNCWGSWSNHYGLEHVKLIQNRTVLWYMQIQLQLVLIIFQHRLFFSMAQLFLYIYLKSSVISPQPSFCLSVFCREKVLFTNLELKHCSLRRVFFDRNSTIHLFCRLFRDQPGYEIVEQNWFQQVLRKGDITRNFKQWTINWRAEIIEMIKHFQRTKPILGISRNF